VATVFDHGLPFGEGLKSIRPWDTASGRRIWPLNDLWPWMTYINLARKKSGHSFWPWPTFCRRFEVNPSIRSRHTASGRRIWPLNDLWPWMTYYTNLDPKKSVHSFWPWPTFCRRFEVIPSIRSRDTASGRKDGRTDRQSKHSMPSTTMVEA
jgi:hypothetical protein